ncbi:Myb-like DNA-binding domain containing protein [Trichomonas vaginalis G3]|uniref:Myb-like DNA-binding domain containing protein n=2 Tax=Trichomonas vaginalis (strain ATCC PRA-98 / G3) TaxID=412133 RepID=A2FI43_TRIV3|nr:Myb-like DNA-binding domain containing protein [Trichomonas vaginalis G3]|eukprot:XP_001308360.1 Myb-like DNA-binding domain containing protein [Trichomonas vaginalis G3]
MSEDAALQSLVKKYGDADWSAIANALRTKNSRQCHDRWFYYLSPKLNRNPFTEEEDNKLIQLEKKYGQHWVKIAKHFSGRTDTQIKNRWNVIKRRLENDRPIMTTTYINQAENPFDYNPQQLFWDAQNLFQFSQMTAQY